MYLLKNALKIRNNFLILLLALYCIVHYVCRLA